MAHIGEIKDTIMQRPGLSEGRKVIFIPNPDYDEFWEHAYESLQSHAVFTAPVPLDDESINPFFGYFGPEYHPIIDVYNYFHLGLDIEAPNKTPVYPIAGGVLQYAGFSPLNGNYVMLSHPNITSVDGFVLYTMYMHLRDCTVGFTQYQKMLREISLRTYPEIMISSTTQIGTVGTTGNVEGFHAHVHLQCEFRHKDGRVVAIDPARLLNLSSQKNLTADITNKEEFMKLHEDHKGDMCNHCLESYWGVSPSSLEDNK